MGRIVKKNARTPLTGRNNEDDIWLFRDHTFGRDPRCSTVLHDNAVSRFHARISWSGSEWTLRDLGSRNGTYINGRLQANGKYHRIKAGDTLLFGNLLEEYLLLEDDAPRALVLSYDSQNQETRTPLTHLHPLPSVEHPLCTLFCGKNGGYSLENENGETIALEHGETFTIENMSYRVIFAHQPDSSPQTASSDVAPGPGGIRLVIAVSPDEESAEIKLYNGIAKHAFAPKAHFYLLAFLARLRNERIDNNTADESGWVDCDIVCKELMLNKEHLAQQVFRIRQEFKACCPSIAEQIIDRRLRGKMRIGLPATSVNVCAMG